MKASSVQWLTALPLSLALAVPAQVEPCTVKRLGLEITTPSTPVAAGTPARVVATLHFQVPTAALRVVVTPGPGLCIRPEGFAAGGPWARGEEFRFDLEVTATGAGTGEAEVVVMALDALGQPAEMRRALLSTLTRDGLTWSGAAGPTNLDLRRLDALRAAGRLSSAEAQAEAERQVTVTVAPDTTPRLPDEPGVHARALGDCEGAWRRRDSHRLLIRVGSSAGGASITVSGHAAWTDSAGATHGIPVAAVRILEDDGAQGYAVVGTTETDAAGDYFITVNAEDDPGAGGPDIAVEVLARSPFAEVRPAGPLAEAYRLRSPVYANQADGAKLTVNLTAGKVQDGETAFSIHHSLVVAGEYAASLAGVLPPFLPTLFPADFSYFDGSTLHIGRLDRWDWDLIQHEYAHHVEVFRGLEDSQGGAHSIFENLGVTDKHAGIRLAWAEGWATFFAISAQTALATASLGVPGVGDTSYSDTEDADFSYDLETERGVGEDNELSVQTALWDLVDAADDGADHIALPGEMVFQALDSRKAVTFGEAWEAIAGQLSPEMRSLAGAVVGQAAIAPELLAPAEVFVLLPGDPPPVFRWRRNGGGTAHPLDDFRIRFWRDNWSDVVFEKGLGNTDVFTPSADELGAIFASGGRIRWVVEGRSTASPETPGGALGRYWSGARALLRADSPPRIIRRRLWRG